MSKKINLGIIALGILAFSAVSAMAQEAGHENGTTAIVHFIEAIIAVPMVIMAFKASGMFAQELGKAMKFLAIGLIFIGVNSLLEGFSHIGIKILPMPEGLMNTAFPHLIAVIGFILLVTGFYKIYNVAKGVAGKGKASKS